MVDLGTRHSRSTAGPTAIGYTNNVETGREILPGTTEVSDSLDHGGFPELLGSGRDVGGAWLMTRDRFEYALGRIVTGQFAKSHSVISSGHAAQSHPSPPSDASLYPLGATAISNSFPTTPAYSAVTTLGETLADGFPLLPGIQTWRDRTKVAKNAGGEYLNVEFGWLPLVSDLRKFAKAVNTHERNLQELKAGSGHTTRAGFEFPSIQTSDSGTGSMLLHKAGNTGVSVSVNGSWYSQQTKRTWFKGAFRYLIPTGSDWLSKSQRFMALADKLYGIEPTPDAVWNFQPWTWALDWFTNAGDIVTNLSRLHQDNMVLEYGYLMQQVKSVDIIGTSGTATGTWSSCSRTRYREFKKRIPASPYGFGISDGDLSSTQKAIIAALGLTMGHGGRG